VPSLATSLRAPLGGFCANKDCWRESTKGFKYTDSISTPDGMAKLTLKAGELGKSSLSAQGRDPNLDLPLPIGGTVLKQDPMVVVQLINDLPTPGCWEARYTAPAAVNNFERFKDRSD